MQFQPNPRTAPTVNTVQLRGVENQNSARVIVDMQDEILLYLPNATPLVTLTGYARRKREVANPRYDWLEKDEFPRTLDVTVAYDSDDTAISVTAGQEARVTANSVVINTRTGEHILVLTTSSGSLATVTRGIGGGQSDGVIGDKLLVIGKTAEDGADVGAPRSIQEFSLFNYTEITRTEFGFTGRDLQAELYGGRDEVTETKWQAIEHKKSLEYKMIFGKRHTITGTHQQSFMDGLDNRIVTNRWNVAGTALNTRSINEALEYQMKWGKGGNLKGGAGTKYLLCSSRWLTQFSELGNAQLQYRVLDEKIGFSAMEYNSPHGKIMLVRSAILDYYHPDYAFLIDPNHLRYVYYRGRDTKLLYDRQGNGVDGRINEYFSDCSLQTELEFAHSVWYGITT